MALSTRLLPRSPIKALAFARRKPPTFAVILLAGSRENTSVSAFDFDTLGLWSLVNRNSFDPGLHAPRSSVVNYQIYAGRPEPSGPSRGFRSNCRVRINANGVVFDRPDIFGDREAKELGLVSKVFGPRKPWRTAVKTATAEVEQGLDLRRNMGTLLSFHPMNLKDSSSQPQKREERNRYFGKTYRVRLEGYTRRKGCTLILTPKPPFCPGVLVGGWKMTWKKRRPEKIVYVCGDGARGSGMNDAEFSDRRK
nr:hypothetical protein Iba_chr13dCG2010 [Ipomoea batatas]